MLKMAREKLDHITGISFDLADACALPYDNNAFDSVACLFGLMYCVKINQPRSEKPEEC